MAITAVNAAYLQTGPTASGQILAPSALGDLEISYIAKGTVTLDGSTTTFTFNFIDGTQTLPFVPTAVVVHQTGGTQGATLLTSTTPTNTGVTINLGAAGTNTNTIQFIAIILK